MYLYRIVVLVVVISQQHQKQVVVIAYCGCCIDISNRSDSFIALIPTLIECEGEGEGEQAYCCLEAAALLDGDGGCLCCFLLT